MLDFLKLPEENKKRKLSFVFLSTGIVLFVASLTIGIPKNTLGSTVFFFSIVSLMLVYIHVWKKVSKFQLLTIFSVISMIFFIMAHNIFAGTAEVSEGIPAMQKIIEGLDILFFYIAVFVSPAGVLIGVGGLLIYYIRKLRNRK